jgi:Protein of unknown function (DUF2971)
MNPLVKMRDPRESKDLRPEMRADGRRVWTSRNMVRFASVLQKSVDVKKQVKVLSLTEDDVSVRPPEEAIFGRGFAHPRLWEQYADNHRGICLCFDRQTLVKRMRREVKKRGERLWYGPVAYRDGPIKPEAYTFSEREFYDYCDEEIIDRLITANRRELFFTKTKDWQTENEFRFVVPSIGTDPLPVFIRDALRVVLLGELTSEHYTPAILALLGKEGVAELNIRVLRLQWQDGAPFLRDPTLIGYS